MKKKLNVVLDLDQTIVSSELLDKSQAEEGDKIYIIDENKDKAAKFEYHNMEGMYVIFERPYVQKFLTFLFANFNVSVWTAASQDYANFILKNIVVRDMPERQLDFFLCSYNGKKSSLIYDGASKKLQMLWEIYNITDYNEKNTVIVDDYDEVWNTQKHNCLIAKEFCYFKEGSENDTFLENLEKLMEEYVLKENELNLSEIVKMINDSFDR